MRAETVYILCGGVSKTIAIKITFARVKTGPPEHDLKEWWPLVCDAGGSVLVPHDGDESQLVQFLGDGEELFAERWHPVKLYPYLTHICQGSTEKKKHGHFKYGQLEATTRFANYKLFCIFFIFPSAMTTFYKFLWLAHLLNHCIIESRSAPSTSTLKNNVIS